MGLFLTIIFVIAVIKYTNVLKSLAHEKSIYHLLQNNVNKPSLYSLLRDLKLYKSLLTRAYVNSVTSQEIIRKLDRARLYLLLQYGALILLFILLQL